MASENLKIWLRFTAKRHTDGAIIKFRIQDLPKYRIEEVLDFRMKYFITEEVFQKAPGIYKNEKAMAEYREVLKRMMYNPKTHTDVCYLDDGAEPAVIAGISTMAITNKDDSNEDKMERFKKTITTEEVWKLFEILKGTGEMFDVFKTCDVQTCYGGRGILVHPDYRKLGIAKEFMKTRRLVCQAEGIPVTEAWMTSIGTQKAAARDGWQTGFEVSAKELEQQFNVPFDVGAPVFKVMYAKIN